MKDPDWLPEEPYGRRYPRRRLSRFVFFLIGMAAGAVLSALVAYVQS